MPNVVQVELTTVALGTQAVPFEMQKILLSVQLIVVVGLNIKHKLIRPVLLGVKQLVEFQ